MLTPLHEAAKFERACLENWMHVLERMQHHIRVLTGYVHLRVCLRNLFRLRQCRHQVR